jgi:hypothetical protein
VPIHPDLTNTWTPFSLPTAGKSFGLNGFQTLPVLIRNQHSGTIKGVG